MPKLAVVRASTDFFQSRFVHEVTEMRAYAERMAHHVNIVKELLAEVHRKAAVGEDCAEELYVIPLYLTDVSRHAGSLHGDCTLLARQQEGYTRVWRRRAVDSWWQLARSFLRWK